MMTIKALFDLSGQTAVITGGSKGLGLEMAAVLATAGANIILTILFLTSPASGFVTGTSISIDGGWTAA